MRAFWLDPDWSGGDNLRDPGTVPFWVKPTLRLAVGGGRHIPLLRKGPPAPTAPWGDRPIPRGPGVYHRVHIAPRPQIVPDHTCGPFVTLWTGYRYCKICEKAAE